MKKLSNLFMMALSLFAFASCESTGTDPVAKPTIEISGVKSTETSVEFTITTTNADRFEYSVALASDAPSYTEVKGEETKTITVDNLTTGAEYAIVATAYNGELSSETVVKNFKAEAGYVPVNYEKIVLLHKFTATDCPRCPGMIKSIKQVQENVDNEIVVISTHCQLGATSQYIIPESRELMTIWGIQGYPSGVVDYYMKTSGYSYSGVYTPVKRSLNDNPAMAGISFSSKLEGNTLKVTGEVAYEETAKYKICAVVVEDGLICNNATGGDDDGSGRPWLFNHVARDYATFGDKGSSVEGVFLGEILAGTKQEFTCTVEWNSEWKSENCSVIVYVMKEAKAGKYPITNCNHAKVGESVEAKVIE